MYDYIRSKYKVSPDVGYFIRHKELAYTGVIVDERPRQPQLVFVKFGHLNYAVGCHPMAIEYLTSKTSP